MKRTPDCTREIIVGLKEQGLTQHEIAKRVGVSPATVSRLVGGMCHVSEDGIRMIRVAFERGESCASIARRLGLHPSTVSRIVRGKTVGSLKVIEQQA